MSFIYALISRSKKIILSDYTEFTGNFPQISLTILSKAKSNIKCTISYNEYNFYYHEENDICYLLIGKNLREEKAFSFIEDLRKKFLSSYESDRIYTAFAYELKSFNEEIKNLMIYHEKNPKTKNEVLRDSLVESAMYIQESYDQLIDRNQKLTIVNQKSDLAKTNSFELLNNAKMIRDRERRRRIILYILTCFILLGFLLLLIYIII